MQMKKRFVQTTVVLFAGLLLYAFGVWESNRQNRFTGEREKRFYPTETEKEPAEEELVEEEPVEDEPVLPMSLAVLSREEQEMFYESLKPQIQRASEEVGIVYARETAPFSESVLAFIRQCAVLCLQMGGMPSYLEPYWIDGEKGRERFLQLAGEEYFRYVESCDEVYHYVDGDGNENFLVSEYLGGSLGVVTLEWYRDEGEGLYRKESLVDYYLRDSVLPLQFEGQVFWIVQNHDFQTSRFLGLHVIAQNDAGDWEHYYFSYAPKAEDYEITALCAETTCEALSSYVEEIYKEVVAACEERRIYTGKAEKKAAQDSSFCMADVDNDGEQEYFGASYDYTSNYYRTITLEYGIYDYRNENYVELSIDDLVYNYEYLIENKEKEFPNIIDGLLLQLWFEEVDGVTYLFTVELLSPGISYLLHARIIRDGSAEEAGVWLLNAALFEQIEEASYCNYRY
ncbi:MAG: hypothetical protein HDR14_03275 [Lachnospiraceae bacterium]|nr:hypothetical protein [Lachnospiraceae bacterium]